jgi:hypothetical protein
MRGVVANAVMGLLVLSTAARSETPTFSFTPDEFHKALDSRIREDTTDKTRPDWSTVKACRKTGSNYVCTFNDAGFQSMVAEFKKMDLANGRFNLKLRLTMETANGKVSRIILEGDRGDPMNLMQWAGTVVNAMQTFDPDTGKGDGQMLAISKELGLMRGDVADDIGEPTTTIKPYAVIGCLSAPSQVSTRVTCQFIPRS